MAGFYYCERCGSILDRLSGDDAGIECCGDKMQKMEPVTDDAAREKHAPVLSIDGDRVTVAVGKSMHPMTDGHKILWVYLRTDKGGHYRRIELGEEPRATFITFDEEPKEVFAYCSLHGLWRTEVKK